MSSFPESGSTAITPAPLAPPEMSAPETLVPAPVELSASPFVSSSVPPAIPSAAAPSFAARFKASLRNLRKISSPTVQEDGIPVVQAPASVLLQSANQWKGHIVAQFHGLIPPPSKIYSDLNPAWGKFGNIVIRTVSDSSCLIMIPCVSTREWVLQVGYWQAGNCAFSVYPWSPDGSLEERDLTSAPTWAVLKNVPPQMYSLDGISVIASAIGEPLHTEKSRLDPFHFGDTKVKVEIMLDSSPPETIIVRDSQGNSLKVNVAYPRLPPKCCNCGRFGHLLNRCPKPLMSKAFDKRKNSEFAAGGTKIANTKISFSAPAGVAEDLSEKDNGVSDLHQNKAESLGPSQETVTRVESRRRSRSRARSSPPVHEALPPKVESKAASPPETDQDWQLVLSKKKKSESHSKEVLAQKGGQNKSEVAGTTPFASARAGNQLMNLNLKLAPSSSRVQPAPRASLMYSVKKKSKKEPLELPDVHQGQNSSVYSSVSSCSRSTRERSQGRASNL